MARRKTTGEALERIAEGKAWKVITGDVEEVCRTLDECSFDAVLCDPPYGLSFMGKAWDYDVPKASLWAEVLRVLKPGAPVIAFSGTRTYHRTAVQIEDGGFEIADMFSWIYGQGWPKGLDISKAVDAKLGAERKVTGRVRAESFGRWEENAGGRSTKPRSGLRKDEPATPQAAAWSGYNTALKPACEPAALAFRPHEGRYVDNVLKHGVGALNIDDSRIGIEGGTRVVEVGETMMKRDVYGAMKRGKTQPINAGRYPSNVILGHLPSCRVAGTRPGVGKAVVNRKTGQMSEAMSGWKSQVRKPVATFDRPDEEVWECEDGCPVKALDEQSGERPATLTGRADPGSAHENPSDVHAPRSVVGGTGGGGSVYADAGGASRYFKQVGWEPGEREEYAAAFERFFYAGKANPKERGSKNDHPTVKPMELMRYLARLLLPPKPTRILVPFCGSGSEMLGCLLAGWPEVVGIELDPRMADVARWRVENARIRRRAEVVTG